MLPLAGNSEQQRPAMLPVQPVPHPQNMAVTARLAFQPAMAAALLLAQHTPTAHFITTVSHILSLAKPSACIIALSIREPSHG
ncbi:hypothetical protein GCM10023078_44690 [Gibbsiella greigii]